MHEITRFQRGEKNLKFGAHYLPTYVPDLDGPYTEFYRRMFEQMEELDKLGFDHIWVTEHHFGDYGGSIPHPPTFLSAVARGTRRIRLGVAISVLPLHISCISRIDLELRANGRSDAAQLRPDRRKTIEIDAWIGQQLER